jgi:hypothetical protein
LLLKNAVMRLQDPLMVKSRERPPGKETQVELVGPLTVSTTVLLVLQEGEVYAVMLYVPTARARVPAESTVAAMVQNFIFLHRYARVNTCNQDR